MKNLSCRTDGILGQDFLSKFNCILDFERNILTIQQGLPIEIPLQMGQMGYNNYRTIPPRCEFTYFMQTNLKRECVVLPKQLSDGVFLASILINPIRGKIPLKILNTREEEVKLSYFVSDIIDFSEYSLCSFEKSNVNAERVKKLLNICPRKSKYLSKIYVLNTQT